MAEVLQTVSSTKPTMSWEEFLAAGEEWQRWELVDEEVEFMSPTGYRHSVVISRLSAQLEKYCQSHREWIAGGADAAFGMKSGNWRCLDVTLVRSSRFSRGDIPTGRVDFPPDVVFEVYFPGDTAAQIARKRKDHQESGVIQVWIDPEKRQAELVYPDGVPRYFDAGQPLVVDGLKSFSLDLKALFSV
jgi:Uma2 family endonuclease